MAKKEVAFLPVLPPSAFETPPIPGMEPPPAADKPVGRGPAPCGCAPAAELLTPDELRFLDLMRDAWDQLLKCTVGGTTAAQDLSELAGHVHALQQAVASNAAARAYPGRFRLLGE